MCTLVAIAGLCPGIPLVVAANRDELYARASSPPAVLVSEPGIVAGRDLSKGGTWLGVTEHGFFVAVTNQRSWVPFDPSHRSRGELVLELLRAGSPAAAIQRVGLLDARAYTPFNLLFGDAGSLHVAYARDGGATVAVEPLGRGVWVLNNDTIGSRDFPKASRALDLVSPRANRPWDELLPVLESTLGDHELPPLADVPRPESGTPLSHDQLQALQALCVHTPVYGTRSATVLGLATGRVLHYRFANGPPCTTPFEDVTLFRSPEGGVAQRSSSIT
jgi:uncharacterized protein with NRDE domain